ncbi:phosphatase PAP2 family protein [Acidobacteriota bacterium]
MKTKKTKFKLKENPITVLLILFLSFLMILGLLNRFMFAPKIFLLLLTILLAVFLGKLEIFYKDWFVFLSFIYLFDTMRGVIYILTCRWDLPVHTLYVIKAEKFLFGEIPSVVLQRNLLDPSHYTWLEKLCTAVHGTHFIAFLIIGLYIWLYKKNHFSGFKLSFYLVTFIGVLGYFLVPTTPPWIASKFLGVLPETVRFNVDIYNMSIPDITSGFNTNPVAAMPSLHTAFPVLCSLILWRFFKWKSIPFILYTLFMLFTIVYTSDHYIVDIIAGSALAAVCYILAFRRRKEKAENKLAWIKAKTPRLVTGLTLLFLGISIGMMNKHQFDAYPEKYDLRYSPTYADFFKDEDSYIQNHRIQMYFGNYYLFRTDYTKALGYFEQALKVAEEFPDQRLAESRIRYTENLLQKR